MTALAIAPGSETRDDRITVCSADTDFARFDEIGWVDPLTVKLQLR